MPPRVIRELRDLTRYRKAPVRDRLSEVNRLHKVLESAGVKLSSVATNIMGVSGQLILDALVAGEADPEALAQHVKARLRAKLPALRKALDARFRAHHRLLVLGILAHIDHLDAGIATLGRHIDVALEPHCALVEAGLNSDTIWANADVPN